MAEPVSFSTHLTIDLAALRANWRMLADMVAPAECAAVVKADAYGIGLEQALHALTREGARTFFVARLEEGVFARKIVPDADIYILDGLLGDPATFLEHNLRPVLGSLADLARWVQTDAASRAPAALQIDTGMNRLGLSLDELTVAKDALADCNLALVLSHFTSSETLGARDNDLQIARFDAVRTLAPKASLANSSGIFLGSQPWFDMVRPGYALYGGNPTPDRANPMRPAVTLEAPILRLRDVADGDTVGYNNCWTARRPTRIATIALGYADGIPRGAAGTNDRAGPDVAIAGQRCPIVGRISMDLITLDVTDIVAPLAPGTPVEILGTTIGIDEFGLRAGTIGYEILTSLGRRYQRVYAGG